MGDQPFQECNVTCKPVLTRTTFFQQAPRKDVKRKVREREKSAPAWECHLPLVNGHVVVVGQAVDVGHATVRQNTGGFPPGDLNAHKMVQCQAAEKPFALAGFPPPLLPHQPRLVPRPEAARDKCVHKPIFSESENSVPHPDWDDIVPLDCSPHCPLRSEVYHGLTRVL